MKKLTSILALSLAASACGGTDNNGTVDAGTKSEIEPKLSVIVQNIFVPKGCLGCHDANGSNGDLSLTAANAYSNLVNVDVTDETWPSNYKKRVAPNDPANSALVASVQKLEALDSKLHMPQGILKLTQSEIDAISTWIQNGAQNN